MPRIHIPESLSSFDELPDSAQVDVKTIAGLFGCAIPTIWRRTAAGAIPAPRKFGGSTRWNVGELCNALAAGLATEVAA